MHLSKLALGLPQGQAVKEDSDGILSNIAHNQYLYIHTHTHSEWSKKIKIDIKLDSSHYCSHLCFQM